jgi:hypothetical protein
MQCLSFIQAPPSGITHCCLALSAVLVSHTAPVSAVQSLSVVHGTTVSVKSRADCGKHADNSQPGSLLMNASVCMCTNVYR